MNGRRLIGAIVLLFLSLYILPAQDQGNRELIAITEYRVFPDNPADRILIEGLAAKAAQLASRIYDPYIRVEYAPAADTAPSGSAKILEYRLSLNAVLQEESTALAVTLRPVGNEVEPASFSITSPIGSDTASYLANVIFYLWSAYHGYLAEGMGEPASYVDELPAAAVARSVLPGSPAVLIPTSSAVRTNGNILVGFSMLAVELDNSFRIVDQPGKSLYEAGNYTYASGVSLTPGGTIYFKPAMGREIYRLVEGMSRPQKIRVGIDLFGPFGALPDGSVVLLDIQKRRALRVVGKKSKYIELFTHPYSYISALAVGPEGNLWLYDAAERRLRIHSPDGEQIDSIMPLVDQSVGTSPLSLAVYRDGRFLLFYSSGQIWCFNRLGVPLWKLTQLPGPQGEGESLPQAGTLTVDSGRGYIYLTDQMSGRLVKFLDLSYASQYGLAGGTDLQIIDLNRELWRNAGDPQPVEQIAFLYEQAAAFEMAQYHWERVLDLDPFHAKAPAKLDELEIAILKQKVWQLRGKTIEVLETVGPETARPSYSQTVQLYEKILSLNPNEQGIREAMQDLKARFRAWEALSRSGSKPLTIAELSLENLFPSLMQQYHRLPVGRITLTNSLKKEVHRLKASIFIKKFMDFPLESDEISRLAPGHDVTLDLPVLLNRSALELQEDLPVQAQIEVSYLVDGELQTLSRSSVLTIYRRTALQWDDSGKICSFITPNEEIITRFAHRVSAQAESSKAYQTASSYLISKKFLRAMRIIDALGAYGLDYIEDPDSPISAILGRKEVIDTVRFPRNTLLIRSGDCDDTTALLTSLLEAAGIRTAVLTSPGHVFMAFDSEEPVENNWLFKRMSLETVIHRGTVWIPVETTILNQGFVPVWQEASSLIRLHSPAGAIEFLSVESQRDRYPPLPLPASSFTVVEPAAQRIDALHQASLEKLEQILYGSALTDLSSRLDSARGRSRVKVKNRLAILHALFGRDEKAQSTFEACIDEYPQSLSAYINLANLKMSRKDLSGARSVLQRALSQKPDSALVNLLLAKSYYREKDRSKVRQHFLKVKEQAPELAERYSYLLEGSEQLRAGENTTAPLWAVD